MDFVVGILENLDALRWLLLLAVGFILYRALNDEANPIEWWEFIASLGRDGKFHADLNKLGQVLGIIGAVTVLFMTAAKAHTDFLGFAAVLLACFAFLGGASSYSAYLRSKAGQKVTETTTEPAPGPEKKTVTETEPARQQEAPMPVKIVEGPTPIKVEDVADRFKADNPGD